MYGILFFQLGGVAIGIAAIAGRSLVSVALVFEIIIIVAFMVVVLTSTAVAKNVQRLMKKARNMEQYEQDIRAKWGADALD